VQLLDKFLKFDKIMSEGIHKIFEVYISKDQWSYILRVSIKYKEAKWLKWIDFFNTKFYRRYFIKIIYKDGTIKYLPIVMRDKEALKANLMFFNFYLNCHYKVNSIIVNLQTTN
jgi:hypothetical protein